MEFWQKHATCLLWTTRNSLGNPLYYEPTTITVLDMVNCQEAIVKKVHYDKHVVIWMSLLCTCSLHISVKFLHILRVHALEKPWYWQHLHMVTATFTQSSSIILCSDSNIHYNYYYVQYQCCIHYQQRLQRVVVTFIKHGPCKHITGYIFVVLWYHTSLHPWKWNYSWALLYIHLEKLNGTGKQLIKSMIKTGLGQPAHYWVRWSFFIQVTCATGSMKETG